MRQGGHRGVILADVMIAFFILSVGLIAVIGLFIQAGQAGGMLSRQEHAACFAADGMERLRHWGSQEWTAENLADAAETVSLEKEGIRYERITELRPRPDLDPTGHLLEAAVRVSWEEKNQLRQCVLLTYFAVDTELEGIR